MARLTLAEAILRPGVAARLQNNPRTFKSSTSSDIEIQNPFSYDFEKSTSDTSLMKSANTSAFTGLGTSIVEGWTALVDYLHFFPWFPEAPELIITAAPWVPHVTILEHEDGSRSLEGPAAKTIDSIADALNFTYTVIQPPDGAWGLAQQDGSWTGMVGQVVRKEADVGIGPFAMTYSRSIAIDFTAPILQDYFRILVRSGLPEPDPWGFLKPFTVVTWIGILLSGLTTCCALLIAIQVSRTRLDAQQSIALWVRYFFKLLGVILAQDFKVLAVEAAVYALVGGWMIFCLVMMRSFAGALTSQLSVRYVPTPIRNLEELVRHPSMKVVLETQTTFSDYVRTTKEGPFGELSTFYDKGRVKEVTSLEFPKTMLDEVSSGEYVLLTDELTLLRLLSLEFSKTGICSYYLAEDRFKPWLLSFIGSKNHPLVPAMSDKIMSIVESGLYMRWLMEEIPNATSCNSQASTMSVSEPYDMQGLWGVFVLLTCGLSLAVVVFVYEVMNPKHQNLLLLKSHRIAE